MNLKSMFELRIPEILMCSDTYLRPIYCLWRLRHWHCQNLRQHLSDWSTISILKNKFRPCRKLVKRSQKPWYKFSSYGNLFGNPSKVNQVQTKRQREGKFALSTWVEIAIFSCIQTSVLWVLRLWLKPELTASAATTPHFPQPPSILDLWTYTYITGFLGWDFLVSITT